MSYRDAKRLSGNSTDVVNIPTVDETFSSDNWVENDGVKVSISSGVLNFINTRDGSNDAAVRDVSASLSGGQISGDFILRFEINGATWTTGGDSVFAIGVASGDQTTGSNGIEDAMGMELRNVSGERRIGAIWKNGTSGHIMDSNNVNTAFNWASATTYYCQIKLAGTSLTVSVSTNSNYNSGATTATSTGVAGQVGVKYFKIWNVNLSGGSTSDFIGTIDNIWGSASLCRVRSLEPGRHTRAKPDPTSPGVCKGGT